MRKCIQHNEWIGRSGQYSASRLECGDGWLPETFLLGSEEMSESVGTVTTDEVDDHWQWTLGNSSGRLFSLSSSFEGVHGH